MSEEATNFSRYGCFHTACGRVLNNRRQSSVKTAEYQDVPTTRIEPVRHVIEGARAFNAQRGLDDPHGDIDYHRVMTHRDLITSLGHAYDRLPHDDPAAHKHFDAMRDEVHQQFHHLTHTMGLKFEVKDHDPYASVHDLADDVRNNHRIQVMGTHATGGHPYFSDEDNDKFRAVHDVFGHLGTGRGFDRHGEEAAYQAHSRMFSPEARGAMASETRGQNGSLIVNGSFGPQKIAVLPRHLWHPGLARNASLEDMEASVNQRTATEFGSIESIIPSAFGMPDIYGMEPRSHERNRYRSSPEEDQRHEEWRQRQNETPRGRAWNHGIQLGQQHAQHGYDSPEFDRAVLSHGDQARHFIEGYDAAYKNHGGVERTGSMSRIAVMVDDSSSMRVVAHVSGNQLDILHCPFCGSGAVIGRSDGTCECGYCTAVFTVQTQPQYNGFPQSVNGQPYQWPGMPDPVGNPVDPMDPSAGTEGGAVMAEPDMPEGTNLNPNTNGGGSSDPAAGGDDEDDEDGDDSDKPAFLKGKGDSSKSDDKKDKKDKGNPFAKKKSYRTDSGAVLDEENYIAHLAILFADDKPKMAQMVKSSRKG